MYSAVLIAHSWLRWVVVLTALAAFIRGVQGWSGHRRWSAADDRATLLFTIALDLQVLLGLLLYVSMRDAVLRFWLVEHLFGMIVALVLAHVGRVKIRRTGHDGNKYRDTALFVGLALFIILVTIPWPFMPAARPLFRLGA
jgi:hypothetical protein